MASTSSLGKKVKAGTATADETRKYQTAMGAASNKTGKETTLPPDPTIYLNKPAEEPKTFAEKREAFIEPVKDIPIVGTAAKVMTSPVTTAVLAGTLAALTGIGLATGALGSGAAAAKNALGGTLIYKTSTGAMAGVAGKTTLIARAAGTPMIAANAATAATTMSLLAKLGIGTAIAGLTMTTIGTYPFAGFIKEEALQTLGMASYTAMQKGNLEEAEKALAAQDEVLNPSVWEKIINAVPFLNIQNQLKDFYKAAKLKTEIDRELINQMKIQKETGETEKETWGRIYEEQEERQEEKRKDDEDYYAEIKKNADEAARNKRAEDTAYWSKIYDDRDAKAKADREAEEKYWAAVKKEWAKQKEDSRPSNLNFGLLK